MKVPKNNQYVMFGGTFVLANKLQLVADKKVEGLSTKQWFLMRNLKDMPPEPQPTISMLAKEADTSRQNVSKMLDVLQKQGYVALCNNAEDRRSQNVEITQEGVEVMQQVAVNAVPFFSALFSGISAEECQTAAGVIIKMIENLEQMQKNME